MEPDFINTQQQGNAYIISHNLPKIPNLTTQGVNARPFWGVLIDFSLGCLVYTLVYRISQGSSRVGNDIQE